MKKKKGRKEEWKKEEKETKDTEKAKKSAYFKSLFLNKNGIFHK